MFDVSVIIASYNSAQWLPSTIESLQKAALHTTYKLEIVVVDDGSTDDTKDVLEEISSSSAIPIKIVSQPNQGRFLARWAGVQASSGTNLLIFDSRILMGEYSLNALEIKRKEFRTSTAWNAHVNTDGEAPLVGRFWEVPTHIFWGGYLARPKTTVLNAENFDYVPKGTTCFFVPKESFVKACEAAWPEDNSHLVSDDTKILRELLSQTEIVIEPTFVAIYRPRTTVRAFLKHAFDRGTLFVDSYAGTSVFRSIVLLALATAPLWLSSVFVLLFAVAPQMLPWALGMLLVAVFVVPAALALRNRCSIRAVAGFVLYLIPFAAVFWAGLLRGVFVHRSAFTRTQGNASN